MRGRAVYRRNSCLGLRVLGFVFEGLYRVPGSGLLVWGLRFRVQGGSPWVLQMLGIIGLGALGPRWRKIIPPSDTDNIMLVVASNLPTPSVMFTTFAWSWYEERDVL